MKTPQLPSAKLAEKLGIRNEVYLKYEDQHRYGSHKGRSIPFMIDEHFKNGISAFVISSSGNAALAAIRYAVARTKNKPNSIFTLKVFIGSKIDEKKLELLKNEISSAQNISLEQVENPKQSAMKFEKETGAKWLRASVDPLALTGYEALAEELSKIEGLSAVFIPTSSGTTAEGLHLGFSKLNVKPEIHIVQTPSCHPMVKNLKGEPETPATEQSLAKAIVDLVGHRTTSVCEAVKDSGGDGWIATNDEILDAIEAVSMATGYKISPNSALSVAGLKKAALNGRSWTGPVVCLITGA